jgi:hypothetical protein
MIGRASVERLLELAGEAMRVESDVLGASTEFYERLAAGGGSRGWRRSPRVGA